MRIIKSFVGIISILSFTSGCIKNDPVTFTDKLVEIDQTTWNPNAAGLNYPILTRIPTVGRALTASCPDSTLRRYSGNIRVRINMVGPQSDKEETVGYKIFSSPITTTTFPATLGFTCTLPVPGSSCRQMPMTNAAPFTGAPVGAPNSTNSCSNNPNPLNVSDAVVGTHYGALSGKVTIPANSSFGYIDIQILNPGTSAYEARFLGIQLDGTGSLKPNVNYDKLGLLIDQR